MSVVRELSPGGAFSYGRYVGAQRTVRETWRRHIVGLLDQALERNDAAISAVAAAITTTILAGRQVYAFGAGRMAPTSTIVGAAIIHAIWAEAGERLAARGHAPEVWGSVNRGPV